MASTEMKIDKVLGVGSYGKVYKAKYRHLPCAVKLPMFDSDDPKRFKFAEEFERECRMLSSLKHPNIVQYLDTWIDLKSRRLGLVMELMDENLTNLLKRATGPLPYHIQLNICHDVALALSYLHANAISHRDLSSNNVLLIGEGSRAKVTDFGVSKLMDIDPRITKLTRDPGTTAYMPPEALLTPPQYSIKLDCFSHGVLTIQIITTKFPEPGIAHKTVDDPNDPTGCVIQMVLVPESERRKAHIDLVEPNHPLLPVAADCLRNKDTERPEASEICERLATLKKEERYTLSMQQGRDENQGLLTQQLQKESQLVKNLKDELQKEKAAHENERKKYQKELTEKDSQIATERTERQTELAQRDQLLKKERAEHRKELDQLEKRRAALQKELAQKDQLLEEKKAEHQRELDELEKKRADHQKELAQRDQLYERMSAEHQRELAKRDQLLQEKSVEHQRKLDQLEKKRVDHQKELDQLQKKERDDHQKELDRLEKKRVELLKELSQRGQLLEKKTAEHQRKLGEIAQKDQLLKKERAEYKKTLAQLQNKRAEHQRVTDQLLQKKRAEWERELDEQLKKTRFKHQSEIAEKNQLLENKRVELDQLLDTERAKHQRELADKNRLLENERVELYQLLDTERAKHQRELADKNRLLENKRVELYQLLDKERAKHQRELAQLLEKKKAEHKGELDELLDKMRHNHQRELAEKDHLLKKKSNELDQEKAGHLSELAQLLERKKAEHQRELAQRDQLLEEKKVEHQKERDQLLAEKKAEHQKERDQLLEEKKAEHQKERDQLLAEMKAEHQKERDQLLEVKKAEHQKERDQLLEEQKAKHQKERDQLLAEKKTEHQKELDRLLKGKKADHQSELAQKDQLHQNEKADFQKEKEKLQQELAAKDKLIQGGKDEFETRLAEKDRLLKEIAEDHKKDLAMKDQLFEDKDQVLKHTVELLIKEREERMELEALIRNSDGAHEKETKKTDQTSQNTPSTAGADVSQDPPQLRKDSLQVGCSETSHNSAPHKEPSSSETKQGDQGALSLDTKEENDSKASKANSSEPSSAQKADADSLPRGIGSPATLTPSTVIRKEEEAYESVKLAWRELNEAPEYFSSLTGTAVSDGNTAYFSWKHDIYSISEPDYKWVRLPRCKYKYFGMAVINGKLTTIGGREDSSGSETNVLMSLFTRKGWKEVLPAMHTKRTHPAVAATKTHLVVAGSYQSSRKVEVLHVESQQWSTVQSLPESGCYPQMVLLNNYLYFSLHQTVLSCPIEALFEQCKSTSAKKSQIWTKLPHTDQCSISLVSLQEHLLALGGSDRLGTTPQGKLLGYNRDKNSWGVVDKDIPSQHFRVLATTLGESQVIVVGGRDWHNCKTRNTVIGLRESFHDCV